VSKMWTSWVPLLFIFYQYVHSNKPQLICSTTTLGPHLPWNEWRCQLHLLLGHFTEKTA